MADGDKNWVEEEDWGFSDIDIDTDIEGGDKGSKKRSDNVDCFDEGEFEVDLLSETVTCPTFTSEYKAKLFNNSIKPISLTLNPLSQVCVETNFTIDCVKEGIDTGWDDWSDTELVTLTSSCLPSTQPNRCLENESFDWSDEDLEVILTTNNRQPIGTSNSISSQYKETQSKLVPTNFKCNKLDSKIISKVKTSSNKEFKFELKENQVEFDWDSQDSFGSDTFNSLLNDLNNRSTLPLTTTSQVPETKNQVKPNLVPINSLNLTSKRTTYQQKTIHSYLQLEQTKRPYVPPEDYYERHHHHQPLRYDPEAIEHWVYPTNYPIRDYQFNIVHRALFENTLVSLPTGLGKTFIAAVVMFNFYRWFPKHKVIFTAPTRPLVSQQIEACFKICGIRLADSTELTGEDAPDSRVELWEKKRVFYLTPQILNNDLKRGLIKPTDIACVVFDEAHRAQGAYAYVSVTNELYQHNPLVRILALSATPGRSVDLVQSVVNNLRISRIESRSEESPDIKPYTFEKLIDKVVLEPSTMLEEISTQFKKLILPCIQSLYSRKYIWTEDLDSISSFSLILARETFRSRCLEGWEAGVAQAHFALSISFVRKLELLTKYGFTSFLFSIHQWREESKLNDSKYRKRMLNNPIFNEIIQRVEIFVNDPSYFREFKSHPKLEYLVGYLKPFFGFQTNSSSKVMIFANFRGTVEEIKTTLLSLHPVVRPMSFIGQSNGIGGKGLAQKDQLQVISKFKNGEYNVLICTSIGEEGLDIGEVDLIVCYDCQTSPIRMLQRIGRTGRRRQGRVLSLLTKGSEERSFYRSKELHAMVLRGLTGGAIQLFPDNPRIIPEGIIPTCLKKEMVTPSPLKIHTSFPIPRSNASIELTSEELHRFNRMFGSVIPIYPSVSYVTLLSRPTAVFHVSHGSRTIMLLELVERIRTKGFHHVNYSKWLHQKENVATGFKSSSNCLLNQKRGFEPEVNLTLNTLASANTLNQSSLLKKPKSTPL